MLIETGIAAYLPPEKTLISILFFSNKRNNNDSCSQIGYHVFIINTL